MPPYADGPGYGGAAYGRADAYRPGQPAEGYANPGSAPPGAGSGAAPGYPGDPAGQARAPGYPGASGPARPAGHERPGGGYGETVNGGAYAYVIREEDEFPLPERRRPAPEPPRAEPPRPEQPRPEPPRAAPPRPDTTASSASSAFVPREAGAAESGGQPDAAEPAVPYGPDDPAYGPPSADWYSRDRDREEEEEIAPEPAPEEPRVVRGPFEPLPQSEVAVQAALYQALTDDPRADSNHAGGTSERALNRIKDLYAAADAVGDEGLDKHFERLLERQRQLISDYLKELGPQGPQGRGHPGGAHDRNGAAFGMGQRSPR